MSSSSLPDFLGDHKNLYSCCMIACDPVHVVLFSPTSAGPCPLFGIISAPGSWRIREQAGGTADHPLPLSQMKGSHSINSMSIQQPIEIQDRVRRHDSQFNLTQKNSIRFQKISKLTNSIGLRGGKKTLFTRKKRKESKTQHMSP